MVKPPSKKPVVKRVTPEKPPTPKEATIFSKMLRAEKLTRTEEQSIGGRGLSELAAVAREHAAAKARAEAAKAALQKAIAGAKVNRKR